MNKIYVRLYSTGKLYLFSEENSLEGRVLVENEYIIEEGMVEKASSEAEEASGRILRPVTAEDRQILFNQKENAREYLCRACKKVTLYGIRMKILDADFSYDGKKLTFYFSSPARVDFRDLVIDMAKSFEKLIRLQQVSGRNAARYFDGIGRCGRRLCCASFLGNPEDTTLEMAAKQDLSAAGAGKLTGCCGKLLCCLAFEAVDYQKAEKAPKEKKGAKK